MKDYIIKATAFNYQVRAYAIRSTNTVDEVRRRHELKPLATIAIGRAMTATVLLNSMLKGNDQLTVNINGGGKIGSLLIDANTNGDVRGYVTNHQSLTDDENETLSVKEVVGAFGTMTVTRRNGNNMPFIGQIQIINGEINEEFASYLYHSEQIPSAVLVSTLIDDDSSVEAAGGFMIQLLPGTDLKLIEHIKLRITEVMSLQAMLKIKYSPEDILRTILGEEIEELEQMPVQFECECSRERIANAIISLGKEEILDMIETDGQANAECHFCNEHYFFTIDDLKQLYDVAK